MSRTTERWVDYDPDLAAIGAIEPEFVQEFDYWATRKVVHDHDIEVLWVEDLSCPVPVNALSYHYEELPEPFPIYRTVLRWKWTIHP